MHNARLNQVHRYIIAPHWSSLEQNAPVNACENSVYGKQLNWPALNVYIFNGVTDKFGLGFC